MVAENAPKTVGRRFAMLQAVLQLGIGDNLAEFEDAWKLATSKLDDDDVKIRVVLRDAAAKLRDNLLVNSQQFESNYNKLRAVIQAYLNSNKSWIADDFRNDTKESDPMLTTQAKARLKAKDMTAGNAKAKAKTKATERSPTKKIKSATCADREGISRDTVGHEQTKTEQ